MSEQNEHFNDPWDETTEPEWEEISEIFIQWDEAKELVGVIGPVQSVVLDNSNTALRQTLYGPAGVVYIFLSPTNLQAMLEREGEGALVKICYLGEEKVKSGRSMKMFKVYRSKQSPASVV